MTDTTRDKDDQIAVIIATMTFNELVSMAAEMAGVFNLEPLSSMSIAECLNNWAQAKVDYLEDMTND